MLDGPGANLEEEEELSSDEEEEAHCVEVIGKRCCVLLQR